MCVCVCVCVCACVFAIGAPFAGVFGSTGRELFFGGLLKRFKRFLRPLCALGVCVCVFMCVCVVHVCVCGVVCEDNMKSYRDTHTHTHMCVHTEHSYSIHIHIHTYIQTQTPIHTHTHTHTHTHIPHGGPAFGCVESPLLIIYQLSIPLLSPIILLSYDTISCNKQDPIFAEIALILKKIQISASHNTHTHTHTRTQQHTRDTMSLSDASKPASVGSIDSIDLSVPSTDLHTHTHTHTHTHVLVPAFLSPTLSHLLSRLPPALVSSFYSSSLSRTQTQTCRDLLIPPSSVSASTSVSGASLHTHSDLLDDLSNLCQALKRMDSHTHTQRTDRHTQAHTDMWYTLSTHRISYQSVVLALYTWMTDTPTDTDTHTRTGTLTHTHTRMCICALIYLQLLQMPGNFVLFRPIVLRAAVNVIRVWCVGARAHTHTKCIERKQSGQCISFCVSCVSCVCCIMCERAPHSHKCYALGGVRTMSTKHTHAQDRSFNRNSMVRQ